MPTVSGCQDAALIVRVAYDPQDPLVAGVIRELEDVMGTFHPVGAEVEYDPEEFQGFVLVPYPNEAEYAPAGSLALFSSDGLGWEVVNVHADELWGQVPQWAQNSYLIAVNSCNSAKEIAVSLRPAIIEYAYWILMDEEYFPSWAEEYDEETSDKIEDWLIQIEDAIDHEEEGTPTGQSAIRELILTIVLAAIVILFANIALDVSFSILACLKGLALILLAVVALVLIE